MANSFENVCKNILVEQFNPCKSYLRQVRKEKKALHGKILEH